MLRNILSQKVILLKGVYRKAAIEKCVDYLHVFSQLLGYPRYTGGVIKLCTCLQLILIDKNAMFGGAQFIVDFQEMCFNTKKTFYIDFQKHASIFRMAMLSIINGVWHELCYSLPTYVLYNTNNYLPIKERSNGLICQHALENILNISQRFIKLLNQPTKPHGLVGQFPYREKENKEAYDSIDNFLHRYKRIFMRLLQLDISEISLA